MSGKTKYLNLSIYVRLFVCTFTLTNSYRVFRVSIYVVILDSVQISVFSVITIDQGYLKFIYVCRVRRGAWYYTVTVSVRPSVCLFCSGFVLETSVWS